MKSMDQTPAVVGAGVGVGGAGNVYCTPTHRPSAFPSSLTLSHLRATIQSPATKGRNFMHSANYKCPSVGTTGKFATMTCERCRHTDLYKAETKMLENIFDLFTN